MTDNETVPIVDAHHHFWDLERHYYPWLSDRAIAFRYGDYGAIRRSYLPPDYLTEIGSNRVVMSVHMEAEWNPDDPIGETLWLEKLAGIYGFPSACVAQAWLDRDDVDVVLAAQAACSLVRGVRHKPHAAPTPQAAQRGKAGSMDDPRWRRGYALLEQHGLSFDLQTPWWHLDAAAELAGDFPNTLLIVNHTGLPADRSDEGLAGWRANLERVASCPNVSLKISGLGQPGKRWTAAQNTQIVRDAIAIFGADRCMFASNYPVDKLCAPFEAIFTCFREAVADRPLDERHKLFAQNAISVYRLADRPALSTRSAQ